MQIIVSCHARWMKRKIRCQLSSNYPSAAFWPIYNTSHDLCTQTNDLCFVIVWYQSVLPTSFKMNLLIPLIRLSLNMNMMLVVMFYANQEHQELFSILIAYSLDTLSWKYPQIYIYIYSYHHSDAEKKWQLVFQVHSLQLRVIFHFFWNLTEICF